MAARTFTRARTETGITLVETLLVLTIVGVLASIAVPNIVSARRGYQIQNAGVTTVNRLGEARTDALKRNRQIDVTLTAATRSLTSRVSGTAVITAGPDYLPGGVVFDIGGAATKVISFDALGRPLNPPQTFILRHTGSGQTRVISVLSTGRLTVN